MVKRSLIVVLGACCVAGMFLLAASTIGGPAGPAPTASQATLGVPDLPPPAVAAVIAAHPEEEERIRQLREQRSDGDALIVEHGQKAARAYALLDDTGLDLLSADLPDYLAYIKAPSFLVAKPGLAPIKGYLEQLVDESPSRVNDLFTLLRAVPARKLAPLADYPEALPALLVAPDETGSVLQKYGSRALKTLLSFTPDCYPAVARLLGARGETVFEIEDKVAAIAPDRVANVLALYFFEFGEETTWLEKRVGMETTLFFLTNNLEELAAIRENEGADAVRATMQAILDYADSGVFFQEQIAQACTAIPDVLAVFREGAKDPAARDWFLFNYAEIGGASLLARCYERHTWAPLMAAMQDSVREGKGDRAFFPLVAMADPVYGLGEEVADVNEDEEQTLSVREAFRRAIDMALGEGGTDKVRLVLQVAAAALAEGASSPSALNWGNAAEMLDRMLGGRWDMVPDAYVDREVWWLWDVLPGRDAYRLGRLLVEGFVPTWQEWVSGGWDALNVGIFVVETATGVVDCTGAVRSAMGSASLDALGSALMIVGEHAVKETLKGVIQHLTKPENLLKLAVCAGYFAYDAVLRYGPWEIPNKAELLEVDENELTPFFREQFFNVLKHALLAGLWRPEFDIEGDPGELQLLDPDALETGTAIDGPIALALENLDRTVTHNVLQLLERNDRRRRFLQMLGAASNMFTQEGRERGGPLFEGAFDNPFNNPQGNRRGEPGKLPGEDGKTEGTAKAYTPSTRVHQSDGRILPFTPSDFRPLASESGASPIIGRTLSRGQLLPDRLPSTIRTSRFASYVVDRLLDLLPDRGLGHRPTMTTTYEATPNR